MATAPSAVPLDEARQLALMSNSYTRLPNIIDLASRMDWLDWVILLGEEWSCCDNIGRWTEILLDETPFGDVAGGIGRQHMMTEAELAALAELPDTVVVWRGCYASNKWGLSWSLERDVAARFPTMHRYRQEGQPLLVKAKVAKSDIIALKLDRTEAEIIVLRPKHISTAHV